MGVADRFLQQEANQAVAGPSAIDVVRDPIAARTWLRRWGLLFACDASGEEATLIDRGDLRSAAGVLIDGPLVAESCESLGLSVRRHRAQDLHLALDVASLSGRSERPEPQRVRVARQIDLLRRIPSDRAETSEPYVLGPGSDADETAIAFQSLSAPEGWRVLASAAIDGEAATLPVIVSDGRRIVSGLPLIELAIAKMTMPACPDGYYGPLRNALSWRLEIWLVEQLIAHARRRGLTVLYQHHWPSGFDAAFTIRHDYDRPILDETLTDLLDCYDQFGVKCSVGFLDRLQPAAQMAALHARGHEIVLHSEAASEAAFAGEVTALRAKGLERGFALSGMTCHGGIGSAGHLGATTFAWVGRAGLDYTEQLGCEALIPHPALSAGAGKADGPMSVMITPSHKSLDTGTAPLAHALPSLVDKVPRLLAAGGLVTVMNHPDIHLDQLKTLLSWLDLSRVWCATHADITAWCRQTKYAAQCRGVDGDVEVNFGRPLPQGLTIDVLKPEIAHRLHLPAGTETRRINLRHRDPSMIIDRADFVGKIGRGLERAAARFRKSAVCPLPLRDRQRPSAGPTAEGGPAKQRMEQPARAAVIGRTQKEAEEAASALRAVKGVFRYPPADTCLFTLSGGEIGLPGERAKPASFFHAHVDGLFDLVYVDPRVKLFATPYGQSFIARVNGLAREGGVLLLPDWQSQAAKGGVGPDLLNDWLGSKGKSTADRLLSYQAGTSLTPPPSVLSWYADHGAGLALEELLFRETGGDLSSFAGDPLVEEFLLSDLSTIEGVRGARSGEGGGDVKRVLEDIVASHAYLISGVSYKAALIRHILETLMPDREDLEYADIGGSYGALAAELLLSSRRSRFAFAITRDIASQNVPIARRLYTGLIDDLAGRFKFSLGPAESFVFDDGFDVVSFVGSLLYVNKDELETLVDRVWSSIRPGGVLIVHENIKSPAFTRDFDVMFEADELDRLLGGLAPIRYFHSSACVELKPEQVANKAVFRVLAKPE
jgi:hypothetical protein